MGWNAALHLLRVSLYMSSIFKCRGKEQITQHRAAGESHMT